jgi:hypothetical protein
LFKGRKRPPEKVNKSEAEFRAKMQFERKVVRGVKKIMTIVLLIMIWSGIAMAIDTDQWTGKTYGGYCIVYNAETGEGFVYANRDRTSLLVVFYPSGNRAYTYSSQGQGVYFADDLREFIKEKGISPDNLISVIRRTR